MNYKTIIIANIAEAFEDALNRVTPKQEKVRKIQIEHSLYNRALLWEGDDKVVVTPFSISPLLFKNNVKTLGFNNCLNLFPKKVNIGLSDAIQKDNILLTKLSGIIKNNPGIRISFLVRAAGGTLMVKTNEYKSWHKALSKINSEFNRDCIWDDGSIIIEEYIEAEKKGISSGYPSSELFLSERGPKITYICDQIVTKAGIF
jgi:hypothetical protein